MVLLFNTRSITFALLVELIVHPKHDMYEDFH